MGPAYTTSVLSLAILLSACAAPPGPQTIEAPMQVRQGVI
jgi:hypothetical protein